MNCNKYCMCIMYYSTLSSWTNSSIPRQSMWNMWLTKWYWDRNFSEYFRFPRQYHISAPCSFYSSISVDKQLDPLPVHVGYVVDKVVVGQIFLRVLPFSLSVSLHQCSVLFYSSIGDVIRSQQLTASLNKTSVSSRILHFRFNIAQMGA
jgi:hypothetical protein